MKRCSVCKGLKELFAFNVNNTKKDGLQTKCRECSRLRSRDYYKDNQARMRVQIGAANRIRKDEIVKQIREWKTSKGCLLCPEREAVALDFHHHNDDKEFSVAMAVGHGMARAKIQREIEKCVVLCSNCHRKLHAGLVSIGG